MDSVSRYCTWQPHSLVWQWSVKSQQRFLFFLWYGEEWRSGSAWDHVLTSSALSVSTGASLWPISSQCWKAVLHLSLVPVISCHPSCLFNQPLIFIWMATVWLHCLSFPDMPLTTKCWCRPSQRCFLAHFSLLVLLRLFFCFCFFFFASRISRLFFFWYDVSQCQGQFSVSEHRDLSVLLKRAATGSAADKFCFHSARPPIHPCCIISTMAPCYRISVLLKRCLLSLWGINYSSAVCHTAVHVWQTNSGIKAELIHYGETHQPAEAQLCFAVLYQIE